MTTQLHDAKQAEHAALSDAFDALFELATVRERVAQAEHDRAALLLADMAAADKAWDEVAMRIEDTLRANALGTGRTALEGIEVIKKHMRELQELVEKHESRVVSHDIHWKEVNP